MRNIPRIKPIPVVSWLAAISTIALTIFFFPNAFGQSYSNFTSREAGLNTPLLNVTYTTSISISSCSTLDTPGATYNLTASITNSATSYCINISTNNITLDCGGNTIDGNDVATYGIWTTNTSAKNFGNVTIQNCKLTDWKNAAIYLAAMDNSTLRWLNVSSSATNGIRVINSNNTIIEHIRTEYSSGSRGIDMAVSNNFLLNNITSYGNGADGIRIAGTSGAAGNSQGRVINSTILYNGGRGLRLDTLFNVYINNLNSSHNALAGVDFISADGSVLINSTINHNLREGIAGSFGADKINISNNRIENNSWAGISHQPTFGFRNAFIYNNFFNNSVNVNVSNVGAAGTATAYNFTKVNGTRVYGAGALLGGNYWANWTGGGQGFSQTCADANFDGFCDTAYTLNINGTITTADYLPYSDNYDKGLPSFVEIPATLANSSNISSITTYFNITAFDLTTNISTCFLSLQVPGAAWATNFTMTNDNRGMNVTCNYTSASFNPSFQGAFFWKFWANDSSSNHNETSLLGGVFDSKAPTPMNYTTLTPDNASSISSTSIVVNVTSSDGSGTGVANLTFTLTNITGTDMTELNRTFIYGFYNYSLNFTSLASGTYLFNVTATDYAGNKNTTERRTVTIAAGTSISISSCTTLDSSDATYNLTSSITDSATSYCINISANNVTLDCGGNTIDGNDIADWGIWTNRSAAGEFTNITIQNCKITDWDTEGIYLGNAHNNTLRWLNVSSNPDQGISATNSNNSRYEHLDVSVNSLRGIRINTASNNVFSNITTNGNGADGFYLAGASGRLATYNIMTNITAIGNLQRGIRIDTANSNTLNNATIYYNSIGLSLIVADFNVVVNSTIYGTYGGGGGSGGIQMAFGDDSNNISNNAIVNTTLHGIILESSANTKNIISNNFFNNTRNFNITFFGTGTSFNTTQQNGTRIYSAGTQIGGNFWANWTGNNDFSKDCADADWDGFCDANYTLNGTGSVKVADYLPYSDEYDKGVPSFVEIPATIGNASNVSSTTAFFNITAFDATTDISTCFLSIQNPSGISLSNVTMTKNLVSTNVTCNYTNSFNPLQQGAFLWKFLANDSSNNWNQTSLFSGVFDSIAPFVDYYSSTPANASTSTGSILMNATSNDGSGTGIANLTFTLTNITGTDMTELNRTFIYGFHNYSLNFTSLASGTYLFNVTATDFAGNKNTTERRTTSISTAPPAQTSGETIIFNGTANYTAFNVTLYWSSVPNADQYRVYTTETSPFNFANYSNVTTTFWTDSNATLYPNRFYRVSSANAAGANHSATILGKVAYGLQRNAAGTGSNWIGLPVNSSSLVKALDVINETGAGVPNSTMITRKNATTQVYVQCSGYDCPDQPFCTLGTTESCNFNLVPFEGYEVDTNVSSPSLVSWAIVGPVFERRNVTLVANTSDTGFKLNWISIWANTSLTNAKALINNISTADAVTKWNETTQTSEGYIQFRGGRGRNFLINIYRGYEVSVNATVNWTQG